MSVHPAREIAAAVVQRPDGRVLLLRRADTRRSYPGKWCFVTGYIGGHETPREAAIRELYEELGITAAPAREGEVVIVEIGEGETLRVYPYLFRVEDQPVRLDEEHTDYTWIEPHEVTDYDIVPQLDDDLRAVGLL